MSELKRELDLHFLDGDGMVSDCHEGLAEYGDVDWMVNNSSIRDYSWRSRILGQADGLTGMITAQIGSSEANVGLDIAAGSNAIALRDLLDSGVIGRALATNYEDRRWEEVEEDSRLGHVDGDLVDAETWRKIITWKEEHAPEGFALAMHRPVGGMQGLPFGFYHGAAHAVLDMVRPDGLMFTQVPRNLVDVPGRLTEVCDSIRERPDVIEVVTSAPAPRRAGVDEADLYAVILKS